MIEKPEFPKPTLIREDFLPYEPMGKYRIKKETYANSTRYYPQVKVLWWWVNLYMKGSDYFYDLKIAKKALCSYNKETMVEYIDFDPARDCND